MNQTNTQRQALSDLPLALTIEEAGAVLKLGRSASYAAARRGEIPTIRIGRSLRVPRQKLAQLLGENENSARAANTDAVDSSSTATGPSRHDAVYE